MASTPLKTLLAPSWRRLHAQAIGYQRQVSSPNRQLEREFHVAFLPILRKLIVAGVDAWFLPWHQLGDQIFSNCDEFGCHEDVTLRLTVAMDLDGTLIATLSQDSPGNLVYSARQVRRIRDAPPSSDRSYPCPLFRELLTGVDLKSGAKVVRPEVRDVMNDPIIFVQTLPTQCVTHGRVWTPRVEVLDTTDLNHAVEVMLGQFADLWRLSRPGMALPPMLVGRGRIG